MSFPRPTEPGEAQDMYDAIFAAGRAQAAKELNLPEIPATADVPVDFGSDVLLARCQERKTYVAINRALKMAAENQKHGFKHNVFVRVPPTTGDNLVQWADRFVKEIADKQVEHCVVFRIGCEYPENTMERAELFILKNLTVFFIAMANPAQDPKGIHLASLCRGVGKKLHAIHDEADILRGDTTFTRHFDSNFFLTATVNQKLHDMIPTNAHYHPMPKNPAYVSLADCVVREWDLVKDEKRNARALRILADPHFRRTVTLANGAQKTPFIKVDLEMKNVSHSAFARAVVAMGFAVIVHNQSELALYTTEKRVLRTKKQQKENKIPLNVLLSDVISELGLREVGAFAGVVYASGRLGGRCITMNDNGVRDGVNTDGNILDDIITYPMSSLAETLHRASRGCGSHLGVPGRSLTPTVLHMPPGLYEDLCELNETIVNYNSGDLDEPNYHKRIAQAARGVKRAREPVATAEETVPRVRAKKVRVDKVKVVLLKEGITNLSFLDEDIHFDGNAFTCAARETQDLTTMVYALSSEKGLSSKKSVWQVCLAEKAGEWKKLAAFQEKRTRQTTVRRKPVRNVAQLCASHGVTELFFNKGGRHHIYVLHGAEFTTPAVVGPEKSLPKLCDRILGNKQAKDIWKFCSFFKDGVEVPLKTIQPV